MHACNNIYTAMSKLFALDRTYKIHQIACMTTILTYTMSSLQTKSPTGCQCLGHYTLNSHFKCEGSHGSTVSPTGCQCPPNYYLINHRTKCRCECESSHNCGANYNWNRNTCSCEPYVPIICSASVCSGLNAHFDIGLNCVCP